ncbi:hypothetical protein AA0119_g8166 [Alternaria tenuissima]|uniref:RING-type domain-containing protein n=1 Tax=Alternaria tenuissima TaxID=119927 RepID=A0ABY0G6I6_9PLEO|nr:hypothetical protein AA0120_g8957 [Alternaria tenuissima]RYN96617.1 hypothetical protein AA0119_g8166 [Alternaria tenuissima]RYO15573.1 hypothetical protein AA0121_g6979 [Alternaria tenuissima]RYO62522.1 hypothetical protein AA0116_g4692 [Alternaria tenuissima]
MRPYPRPLGLARIQSSPHPNEIPNTQRSPGHSTSASIVVTKNKFIEKLQPIKCSICLEDYNSDHVPVELPCSHIFGGHCIVEQTESRMPNNNRCPLCRHELFEQEDFHSFDNAFYSSDEALVEFNDYDDSTDEDERELEEQQSRQMLAAPLNTQLARRTQPTSSISLAGITSAPRTERNNRYQEFREHADRIRESRRAPSPNHSNA